MREVRNRLSQKHNTGRGGDSWYLARGRGSQLHYRVKVQDRQATDPLKLLFLCLDVLAQAKAVKLITPLVQNYTTLADVVDCALQKRHRFTQTICK